MFGVGGSGEREVKMRVQGGFFLKLRHLGQLFCDSIQCGRRFRRHHFLFLVVGEYYWMRLSTRTDGMGRHIRHSVARHRLRNRHRHRHRRRRRHLGHLRHLVHLRHVRHIGGRWRRLGRWRRRRLGRLAHIEWRHHVKLSRQTFCFFASTGGLWLVRLLR